MSTARFISHNCQRFKMSWTAAELALVSEKEKDNKQQKWTSVQLERLRLEIKEKCKTNRSTSAIRHQLNKLKRPRIEATEEKDNPSNKLEEAHLLLWNAECSHCASLDRFIQQQFKDLDTFAQVDTTLLQAEYKSMLDDEVKTSVLQINGREQLLMQLQQLFVELARTERKTLQAKLDEVVHRRDMMQHYQRPLPHMQRQSYYHHSSSSSSHHHRNHGRN